jgi:hypothetical protein
MVFAWMLTLFSSAVAVVRKSFFGDLWVGVTGQVSVHANAIQLLEFGVSLEEIQTGLVDLIRGDFRNQILSLFPIFSGTFNSNSSHLSMFPPYKLRK